MLLTLVEVVDEIVPQSRVVLCLRATPNSFTRRERPPITMKMYQRSAVMFKVPICQMIAQIFAKECSQRGLM